MSRSNSYNTHMPPNKIDIFARVLLLHYCGVLGGARVEITVRDLISSWSLFGFTHFHTEFTYFPSRKSAELGIGHNNKKSKTYCIAVNALCKCAQHAKTQKSHLIRQNEQQINWQFRSKCRYAKILSILYIWLYELPFTVFQLWRVILLQNRVQIAILCNARIDFAWESPFFPFVSLLILVFFLLCPVSRVNWVKLPM